LFNKSNIFGSCIIHILHTGCAKIKKKYSGAKRLTISSTLVTICNAIRSATQISALSFTQSSHLSHPLSALKGWLSQTGRDVSCKTLITDEFEALKGSSAFSINPLKKND